jgi:hypothetical protein
MKKDEMKKALRERITELRQEAAMYRGKRGFSIEACKAEARASECERTLDLLLGKSNEVPVVASCAGDGGLCGSQAS